MKNILLSFKQYIYAFILTAFFLLVGFVNGGEKVEGSFQIGASASSGGIGARDATYTLSVGYGDEALGATVYYGFIKNSSGGCSTSLPNSFEVTELNKNTSSTTMAYYMDTFYDSGLIGTLYFYAYGISSTGATYCFEGGSFAFDPISLDVGGYTQSADMGDNYISYYISVVSTNGHIEDLQGATIYYGFTSSSTNSYSSLPNSITVDIDSFDMAGTPQGFYTDSGGSYYVTETNLSGMINWTWHAYLVGADGVGYSDFSSGSEWTFADSPSVSVESSSSGYTRNASVFAEVTPNDGTVETVLYSIISGYNTSYCPSSGNVMMEYEVTGTYIVDLIGYDTGIYTVGVYVENVLGRTDCGAVVVYIDSENPTASLYIDNSSYDTSHSVTFDLSDNVALDYYEYKFSSSSSDSCSSDMTTVDLDGDDYLSDSLTLSEGSGTYYLYLRAYDLAGYGTGCKKSSALYMDNSGPNVSISVSPGSPVWIQEIEVSVSDDYTSVDYVRWCYESASGYCDITDYEDASTYFSLTFEYYPTGTYYIRVNAGDSLGNTDTSYRSFVIDVDDPIISIELDSYDFETSHTLSVNVADYTDTYTYYVWDRDSSNSCEYDTYLSSDSVTKDWGNGVWYLHVYSSDEAGNSSCAVSDPVKFLIASINGTKYGYLQDAISDSSSGDTIVLENYEAECVTVFSFNDITIDLNGHNFYCYQSDDATAIDNHGTLRIIDSVGDGNIEAESASANAYGIYNNYGAALTVDSGSINVSANYGEAYGIYGDNVTIGDEYAAVSKTNPVIRGKVGVYSTSNFSFYNGAIWGISEPYTYEPSFTRGEWSIMQLSGTYDSQTYIVKRYFLGVEVTVNGVTNTYPTLNSAFSSVSGSTSASMKLLDDAGECNVISNTNVEFNLNGYEWMCNPTDNLDNLLIVNNGNLNIKDSVSSRGKMSYNFMYTGPSYSQYVAVVINGGSFTLKNVELNVRDSVNNSPGGMAISNGGTFVLDDSNALIDIEGIGEITGVYSSSSLVINNGKIKVVNTDASTSSSSAYGVRMIGEVVVNNGEIYAEVDIKSSASGGSAYGIQATNAASVNVKKGTVRATSKNSTSYNAYGVYISSGGVLTVGNDDEFIEENDVKIRGREIGIYLTDNVEFKWYDGTIGGISNYYNVAASVTPNNAEILTKTETYSSETYNVVYIKPPAVSVEYNGNITNYMEFSEAWSSISDSGVRTVKILKDLTGICNYTVASGRNIILDLNGKSVSCTTSSSNSQIFTVSGNLTIRDSKGGGSLNINIGATAAVIYGLYTATSGASITIESGELNVTSAYTGSSTSYYAYGIYASSGASVVVNGGKISVSKNYNVYGVYLTSSSTSYTQSGGEILATTVFGNSYGMYAYAGNVVIKGGKIIGTNTNSGYTVYGIYSRGNSTSYSLTFGESGGTLNKDNPYISGGIYIYSTSAKLYFYDGIIDSGYNNYTCYNSSSYCSSYFDAIESGTVWVDDHNTAFVGIVIEEVDSSGNHVAYHSTLAAAFSNGTSGNTIKMLENLSGTATLASGKTLTLDMNGKTFTYTGGTPITNNGNLTIKGNGTINSNVTSTSTYSYGIQNTGTLRIENTTIISKTAATGSSYSYSYGVYSTAGTLTIINSTISAEVYRRAWGVYVTGGTVTITGSSISATTTYTSTSYTRGIESSVSLSIVDTNVTSSGKYYVYGIYSSSTFTMEGGSVTATGVSSTTYGVYAGGTSTIIKSGTISASSSSSTEYGVYSAGSSTSYSLTFGVKDGELSQSAPYVVGGLYVNNTSAVLSFYDGKINKGVNSYTCQTSSASCSSYFDNIEEGTYWVDDATNAYLQYYAAKEVDSSNSVVSYYDTVQEALNGAGNGNTVSLLINADECLSYTGSNSIILDLNGKNISCDNGSSVITNSGNLSIIGSGKIIAINSSGSMKGINNTGTIKVSGVEVTTSSGSPLTYAIYSTGNLIIGESGGYFSIERPFINGTVYKGSTSAVFSFYEGKIYSNNNACSSSSGATTCSSIFDNIETSASWIEESGFAYLSVSVASIVKAGGLTTYFYGSLQEAINYAESSDTVKLLFNVDECVVINSGKTINLDLNGNSIMCSLINVNGDSVVIVNRGNLTLYNGTVVGDSIDGSYAILNEGSLGIGLSSNTGVNVPTIYGDIKVNSNSNIGFYAGRIYDSCLLNGEVVSCANIIDTIPDGYVLYDNGEYVFLLAYEDSLAVEINGDGLVIRVLASDSGTTLVAFVTAATAGNTVRLYADGAMCLNNSKVLILDLNGYAISCTSGTAITNSGTLTIKGNGTINSTTTSSTVYGINNSGTLTVENTTINAKYTSTSTSYYAYGVYSSAGVVTLNNVNIVASSYAYAYGFYITSSGSAIINGGSISSTTTYTGNYYNRGIYAARPVEMTDTEVTANGKYYVYGIENTSTFTMNSGKIVANGATSTVYGIQNSSGSSFTMNSGEVSATSTTGTVYGMYAYGYTNTIKAGKISATSTSGTVYGVYNYGSSTSYKTTFGVQDGVVSKTSPEIIGGVYVRDEDAYLYFYDGIIKSGKNNYTCQSSSNKCSEYFDAVETGYSWVQDNSEAYLGVLMEELNGAGNHVAYHTSLANAFSNAGSGNTIKLLENISECNVTLASGKTLTLDMNGKNINCITTGVQTTKGIENNGTLIVTGSGILSVDHSYDSWSNGSYGYAYGLYNSGTLTVDGPTISTISSDTYNDNGSEKDTYVYGIYNYTGVFNFVSGTINLDWGGLTTVSDFTFYGIYSAGTTTSSIVTIGSQGGTPSKTNPEINGSIYVASTNAVLNFYDGIIKSGYNNYTCNSSTSFCETYFDNVETGYGWADDGSEAYLSIVMEEVDSSGNHVAYHSSLSIAFVNGVNGNTIKLLDNVNVCNVTLSSGKTLTLDLNGKTITCTTTSTSTKVLNVTGNLTIMDSVGESSINLNSSTYTNYAIYINSGGVVTLNSATISSISTYGSSGNNHYGVYNIGTLNVNGGKIYAQQPYYSYGVYNSAATSKLVINGGEIESKTTNTYSYGVMNYNASTIEMNGGTIKASASQYAYGVVNQSSSTFTMNDGVVSATSPYSYGVQNSATFKLNGGSVSATSSSTYSYGVLNSSSYIQSGGGVTATTSTGNAYGLYANGTVNTIKGGTITGTSTSGTVYGVYNYGSSTTYVTTFGESGGVPSKTNPEINGGVYVYSTSAYLYFYDGIIKKGYNSYTCNSSTAKCSTYFDAIQTGYGWVDNGSEAYLDILIEEVDSSGSRVATHSTLSAAFSSGTNGNTIKLLENLTECNVSLASGKTLTLDLNGKNVNCTTATTGTKILNVSGNLTIMDSVGESSINLNSSTYTNYVIYINSGGVVTLNSATISSISTYGSSGNNHYGVYNIGTLNVNGGKIYAQQPYYSYGVYNSAATSKLVINGGEIESKTTNTYSYGVMNYNTSTIEMNGGTIKASASQYSYGVVNQSSSTFTMNDGVVSATSPYSYGVQNSATFKLNGGSVSATSSSTYAYGVYNSSSYTQSGGSVTATTSTGNAHGLYAYGTVNTIKGGTITATNTSSGYTTIYGVYNYGSSTSYVTTFGTQDGSASKVNPEINGGLYVRSTSATLYFYDGIIKKGQSTSACNGSYTVCASSFDAIETGFAWVDDGSQAYLSIVIDEINSSGEHVAYHSTLAAAFSNGTSGNTIKMLENLSGTATLASGKTLTLDMNGKTFTYTGGTPITNNGNLTIKGNGTINSNVTSTSTYSYGIQNTGTLRIENTTIISKTAATGSSYSYSYGVYSTAGTLTIINSTISAEVYRRAWGVYVTGGTVTITGSSISATTTYTSTSYTRGIYATVALSMVDTEVVSNGKYYVYGVQATANLTMEGGSVTATGVSSTTYGIYAGGTSTIIKSGTISASSSSSTEYGLYSAGSSASYSVTFGVNDAKISQSDPYIVGGVYVNNTSAVLSFYDGKINKGVNSYTCQTSSANCSSYFDNIEEGATWYDDHTNAYLLGSVQEETSEGEVVGIYGTLQASFTNVTNGNTIKMLKDLGECVTLASGKETTLNTNGYTLYGTDFIGLACESASITNNGDLNFDGTIYAQRIGVINTGTFVMNSGTISTNDSYGTGIESEGGFVVINGGTITVTGTNILEGFSASDGTKFEMNGGKIVVNSSGAEATGISCSNTGVECIINDGEIEVTGKNIVAGVTVGSSSTLTISDGSVSATSDSGIVYGIYNFGNATTDVQDGTITANSSTSNAYGLYNEAGGTMMVSGGNVSSTTTSGLAFGVSTAGEATINGLTVSATGTTGKVYGISNHGTLTVEATTVSATGASDSIITIGISSLGTIVINSGTVVESTNTNGQARGLYIGEDSSAEINGGTINSTATSPSYAIDNCGTLTLNGGNVSAHSDSSSAKALATFNKAILNGGMLSATSTTGDDIGGIWNTNDTKAAEVEINNVTINLVSNANNNARGIFNHGEGEIVTINNANINLSGSGALIGIDTYDEAATYINGGIVNTTGGSVNNALLNNVGTLVIGEKGGALSQENPYFEGNLVSLSNTSTIKFYDGKIKGQCKTSNTSVVSCSQIINEIEERTYIVEENGYIYLDYTNVEEVTSDGTFVKYYTVLQKAFDNVTSGNTLKLLYSLEECDVTLASGKTITFDLNGYNLSCVLVGNSSGKGIVNNGNLTIKGEGIINVSDDSSDNQMYAISNSGTLKIDGGKITISTDSQQVYGLYNISGGNIEINNGEINVDGDSGSYGVYNNTSSTLFINGGKINVKGSSSFTAGISNSGVAEINGGEIKVEGGKYTHGIYNRNEMIITGGIINVFNEYEEASGIYGITNFNSATIEINGGEIKVESVEMSNNGINNSGMLTISNVLINSMSKHPCGINNQSTGIVEINGGEIKVEGVSGGQAIGISNGNQLTINKALIKVEGVSSSIGISNGSAGVVEINNVEILVNGGTSQSQGISNVGELTLLNGVISVASEEGIVFGIDGGGATLMEGGVISATSMGSAYGIRSSGEFILIGGSISSVGVSNSYGIYISGTLRVGAKDGTINNELPFINGGIYIATGANVSFYDGRIHGSSYTCKSSNGVSGCALLISEVEDGASWIDDGSVAYIAKIVAQEETVSGEIIREYASLQTAINSASNGNIIRLLGNVKECVLVAEEQILILELNGFGIKCESDSMEVTSTITNEGVLTIQGIGGIEGASELGEIVGISNTGTLNLNGGTVSVISTSQRVIGIYTVGEKVVVNGGVISASSYNNDAIGVYVDDDVELEILAGVINVVSNEERAMGILSIGRTTVTSAAISANTESGEAIGISNEGTLTVLGGAISASSDEGESIGVTNYIGTTTISGGVISSNRGYAIEATDGDVYYNGGRLQGSSANKYTYNITDMVSFGRGNKAEWTEISEDGSMYVTVLVEDAIKIGEVTYGSLKEAVEAAKENEVISIRSNVTSESIIDLEKKVVINTNGYTVNNYVFRTDYMDEEFPFIELRGGELVIEGNGVIESVNLVVSSEAGSIVRINGGKVISKDSKIIEVKNKDLYVKEGNYIEYKEEKDKYIMEIKEGSKINEDGGLEYKVGVDDSKVVIELISTIDINSGDKLSIYLRSIEEYEYAMSCSVDGSNKKKVVCESEVEGLTYVYNMNYEKEMLIIYEDVESEKVVAKEIIRKDLKMTPNLIDNSGEAKFRIEGEGYSIISDGEVLLVDVYGNDIGEVDLDKSELKEALFGPNYNKIFSSLSINMGMPIESCGGGFITCMDLDISGSYASSYPVSTEYGIQIIVYDYRPKLVTSEVEELENEVECEQGSTCNIESLSFVDFKGEEVEVETIVMREGEVVEAIDTREVGRYTIISKAKDTLGNESKEVIREVVIVDKEAPVVRVSKIEGKVGEEIDILQEIEVSDNNEGELKLEVIENNVDVNKEGVYKVGYKVVDSSGNETVVYREVVIEDINLVNIYHVIMGIILALVVGLIGCIFVKKRYTC